MEIKNGKKPLSSKQRQPSRISPDDVFGRPMSVSPEVARAIEAKGLVHRWINYPKWVAQGCSHEKGWVPIKRKDCGIIESSPLEGVDPEGYFRYSDSVLAVRSKEKNALHVAYNRQEAQRASNAQVQRRQADELRQFAKSQGINMEVSEGYDNEE